jgi:hypothetical protein
MEFVSDAEKILYAQWVESEDHLECFEKWKKSQLKELEKKPNRKKTKTVYSQKKPNRKKTKTVYSQSPGQAYLYTKEFSDWCKKRDAQGKEY